MYLKKLEMIGFKSFAEPMTVAFQPGITAIVGPNGCGKSNIVDAVLWVLGEQSTKTLRSDRMEDVIFNGSETRRPLNLSEVILTVGDVAGEVVGRYGDFQEIAISRRLFRTGESEYLINKIPCRLKDVRDLLIDTGAGHKGHTIIEQGKVDQLLNSSPVERRELIEETAGISKYKIRKAEAERKLEATQQNLLRVTDIVGEVKRQINALDRQVKKTQAYRELQEEARGLELRLLEADYRTQSAALEAAHQQLGLLLETESARRADLSRVQAEIQTLKTALLQKEAALNTLRNEVYEAQIQLQRKENRIELLRGQIQSWEEQQHKLSREQARVEQTLSQNAARRKSTDEERRRSSEALDENRVRLAEKEEAQSVVEEAYQHHQRSLEEMKQRRFDRMAAATEVHNQMAALESRIGEIRRIQEKAQAELAGVEGHLAETRGALARERENLSNFEARRASEEKERGRLTDSLAALETDHRDLHRRWQEDREKLTLGQARLESLREKERSLTVSQAGIRSLLEQNPEIASSLHGMVADLFEVPKDMETAIEAALGEQLQGFLIEDHASIKKIIGRLKSLRMGRGLFSPRTLRPIQTPVFPAETIPPDNPGLIGPALDRVGVKSGYEAVARTLLGHVFFVLDLDTAIAVWDRERPAFTLVTLDGEVLQPNGLIWGGQRPESASGLLETRREIRDAERFTNDLQEEQARRSELLAGLEVRIREETERRQAADTRHQRGEQEGGALRQQMALLEAEEARYLERMDLLRLEHDQETRDAMGVEARLAETRTQLDARRVEQEALEADLSRLEAAYRELTERREALRAEATQMKLEMTSAVQKLETLSNEELRLREEETSLRELFQRQGEEAADLASKAQAAQGDIRTTEGELGEMTARLTAFQNRLSADTEAYSGELAHVREFEEQESRLRTELSAVEKQRSELDVRSAEIKARQSHLAEQAQSLYQTTLSFAAGGEGDAADASLNPDGLRERVAEIRTRLEQLGPVNLAAIEEYRELEERHTFLTAQETDLKQSMDELRSAISKINRTTKDLFVSAYVELREKFKEVFQEFFEGGQADLVLLDEDNPLDSGIEIVAQPPGKRLKSITLLSGGEKALTAIALLFSSFLIHPSPFCVLDEIDAPLDEQNIRRFLKVLRKMTGHSQFLIITHNKRTMEQADILYGVTMEEAGVSKLVSVKLESAGEGNGSAHAASRSVPSPSPALG